MQIFLAQTCTKQVNVSRTTEQTKKKNDDVKQFIKAILVPSRWKGIPPDGVSDATRVSRSLDRHSLASFVRRWCSRKAPLFCRSRHLQRHPVQILAPSAQRASIVSFQFKIIGNIVGLLHAARVLYAHSHATVLQWVMRDAQFSWQPIKTFYRDPAAGVCSVNTCNKK